MKTISSFLLFCLMLVSIYVLATTEHKSNSGRIDWNNYPRFPSNIQGGNNPHPVIVPPTGFKKALGHVKRGMGLYYYDEVAKQRGEKPLFCGTIVGFDDDGTTILVKHSDGEILGVAASSYEGNDRYWVSDQIPVNKVSNGSSPPITQDGGSASVESPSPPIIEIPKIEVPDFSDLIPPKPTIPDIPENYKELIPATPEIPPVIDPRTEEQPLQEPVYTPPNILKT